MDCHPLKFPRLRDQGGNNGQFASRNIWDHCRLLRGQRMGSCVPSPSFRQETVWSHNQALAFANHSLIPPKCVDSTLKPATWWLSVGIIISNIWTIKNVPNHQPAWFLEVYMGLYTHYGTWIENDHRWIAQGFHDHRDVDQTWVYHHAMSRLPRLPIGTLAQHPRYCWGACQAAQNPAALKQKKPRSQSSKKNTFSQETCGWYSHCMTNKHWLNMS